MINVEAVRRLLAVAEVKKDPYAVAEVAGALLTANAGDGAAIGAYARALGALGLLSAAQRVVKDSGDKISTGVVPWKSRARRFAANLAALGVRDPAGAALVELAARELERFELHSAADGNFQVLDTTKEMPGAWLGGLAMHRAAEGLWRYDRARQPVLGPVAFESLGFGWLFLKVLGTTERTYLNYSCAVYVLEGDPLGLAMLFHMHDLQESIRQERVRWFIGETPAAAGAAFRREVEAQPSWSLPEQFIRCALRGQESTGAEGMIKELIAARNQRREALAAAAKGYYADKGAAYWRKRYEDAARGRGERLRVLGITSRYTTVLRYSMAELCEAAEAAGQEMRVAMEPDDQSVENPYLEMIAEFKPDLIVQISRMRYENPNLPANVPFLCWDQDNLPCMRTEQATASLDGMTFVAGHGALHGYIYLGWPLRNGFPCHLASAMRRYRGVTLTAEEKERYRCDFSYISNASGTAEALRDEHVGRFGEYAAAFREITDGILAARNDSWHEDAVRARVMRELLQRFPLAPDAVMSEMTISALLVADRAFRHQTLQWVSDYCQETNRTLRLYGAGWEKHPSLGKHAAGPAQQGREVEAISAASLINLQIIGTGILHSRLLDGIAAGGFFLFRRTEYERADASVQEAIHLVSQAVTARDIRSIEELDALRDEKLAAAWSKVSSEYHRRVKESGLSEEVIVRGLASAQFVPHPFLLMPSLREIGFSNAEELRAMATRFLSSDAEREAMGAQLGESLQMHFSYDVRWKSFLAHVMRGLGCGATG
ncbi:MAG: hypothetical protein ACTHN5_21350 [Phycisphaerae bacterium]